MLIDAEQGILRLQDRERHRCKSSCPQLDLLRTWQVILVQHSRSHGSGHLSPVHCRHDRSCGDFALVLLFVGGVVSFNDPHDDLLVDQVKKVVFVVDQIGELLVVLS